MTEIKIRFDFTFSRRFITVCGAVAMMLCAVPELESESVTLSTYYPAPSGVYTNLITTNNTFLARDGGTVMMGTVTPVVSSRLTVALGSIAGTYGLTPSYVNWNAYGTGAGGAAIYNSNEGAYQALMLVGNNSGGGLRRVKVWDELTVNGKVVGTGDADMTGVYISRQNTCTDFVYGTGIANCPGGNYATYTSGVMVRKTTSVGSTDPIGLMLCCPCPLGGCIL